jgi:hypothetical protein
LCVRRRLADTSRNARSIALLILRRSLADFRSLRSELSARQRTTHLLSSVCLGTDTLCWICSEAHVVTLSVVIRHCHCHCQLTLATGTASFFHFRFTSCFTTTTRSALTSQGAV